jgi:hypothetical protein
MNHQLQSKQKRNDPLVDKPSFVERRHRIRRAECSKNACGLLEDEQGGCNFTGLTRHQNAKTRLSRSEVLADVLGQRAWKFKGIKEG